MYILLYIYMYIYKYIYIYIYETFHVNCASDSHPTNSDIPHSWSKYYLRAKK